MEGPPQAAAPPFREIPPAPAECAPVEDLLPPQPPMPGRDDLRVPLNPTVDIKGRWGWVVKSSVGEGKHRHIAYNWATWPEFLEERKADGLGLSDLDTLLHRNHEDNLIEYRYGVEDMAAGFQDWKKLWGRHEGEILVIASCGPSLTQSLPTLYRRRGEFRLMCLNRSLRAFAAFPETKPDYYYFVERRGITDWIHDVNDDGQAIRPLDLSGVDLIATPPADPRIVRAFEARRRYFGWTALGNLGHVPEIKRLTSYDCQGATTLGNAPYIAYRLGFKVVIVVGADFALDCLLRVSKDGRQQQVEASRVYFDRALSDYTQARCPNWLRTPSLPERGVDGRMVLVTQDCQASADYFAAMLDIAKYEAGMECINATPRGVLRFNNMELDEALDHAKGVADGWIDHA